MLKQQRRVSQGLTFFRVFGKGFCFRISRSRRGKRGLGKNTNIDKPDILSWGLLFFKKRLDKVFKRIYNSLDEKLTKEMV